MASRSQGEEEELIWLRQEPQSRRPSHTRAEIASAALAIADEEGFEAVSMRRVAGRLGAGTMTLYHYVRNKDELITLMVDEVMGEVLVPEAELASGWRLGLSRLAERSRDALSRHRWTLDRLGDGRPSPNGLRHVEQSFMAVSDLEISMREKFELISLIDDYVFGFCLREAQEMEEHRRGWAPEVREFLEAELESGAYPELRSFIGDDFDAGAARIGELLFGEGRFKRGLDRLLDGVEVGLERRAEGGG